MPILGQNSPSPYTLREKLARLAWVLVQATFFRWSPRSAFGWRNALLRVFGARIDATSGPAPRVFPTAIVYFPWKLTLAPGVMIGPRVHVYNLAPISLDTGVNISQHAHLCAGTHDYLQWTMPLVTRPIHIGANAWLGTEVFVGPGVTIGELAVIGARSVVVKDQPARMVCAGHPCRPLKPRPDPQ